MPCSSAERIAEFKEGCISPEMENIRSETCSPSNTFNRSWLFPSTGNPAIFFLSFLGSSSIKPTSEKGTGVIFWIISARVEPDLPAPMISTRFRNAGAVKILIYSNRHNNVRNGSCNNKPGYTAPWQRITFRDKEDQANKVPC